MSLSKRKQVNKDDLRRLMKEKKNARTSKIDSPHAKYNNLGQLYCTLCTTQIKSEILWNAHVQGRTHKQNVEDLKTPKVAPPPVALKRKADPIRPHTDSKQPKSILKNSTANTSTSQITSLGLGGYSSSEEEEEDDVRPGGDVVKSNPTGGAASSSLPADFFDSGITPDVPDETEKIDTKPAHMSEVLPEGFFDDPKQDAKARHIEYRDKLEDEWELFQKEMKTEAHVSEQIVEEEDEIITEERRIEEIDEQLVRWTKIDALGKKKDALMQSKKTDEALEESDPEADDAEYEEFLDWRSKASLK